VLIQTRHILRPPYSSHAEPFRRVIRDSDSTHVLRPPYSSHAEPFWRVIRDSDSTHVLRSPYSLHAEPFRRAIYLCYLPASQTTSCLRLVVKPKLSSIFYTFCLIAEQRSLLPPLPPSFYVVRGYFQRVAHFFCALSSPNLITIAVVCSCNA
jgi:hypothetical protein